MKLTLLILGMGGSYVSMSVIDTNTLLEEGAMVCFVSFLLLAVKTLWSRNNEVVKLCNEIQERELNQSKKHADKLTETLDALTNEIKRINNRGERNEDVTFPAPKPKKRHHRNRKPNNK